MEEEVRIVEKNIQVKTIEPEVGIEPLIAIQVENTETVVEKIDV